MSDQTPEAAMATALASGVHDARRGMGYGACLGNATGIHTAIHEQEAAAILANLPEGFALVSVEDVARRLWERRSWGIAWDALGPDDRARIDYMDEARRLLGIGGER